MNTFTVIHPENLFVENGDSLKDPNNKFVIGFKNILNIVTEIKPKVLFSKDLSGAFWSHPPWSDPYSYILDVQIRMSLMSQIYPFFRKYIDEDNDTSKLDPSDSDPSINFFDENSLEETKKLITSTEKYQSSFFLNTDKENYKFSHNGKNLKIKSITSANEIFEQVESFEKWWPKSKSEIHKFKDCLNIYSKKSSVESIYEYNFSKQFLVDFLGSEKRFRDHIIEKVGLRLSMSLQVASKDPTLQDKEIKLRKERRFRVTPRPTSTRIHYSYDKKNNEIIFERFYTEHDDGLRKN